MAEDDATPVPRATYRLQFGPEMGFEDAAALAPYLAALGVSHVYASPWLKARPGSAHGYDIVDHRALNPELGDENAFRGMVEAFRSHGLGQIVDFVPNHMGVAGADNPAWLDVLEWGPQSVFAAWFDIDWGDDPAAPEPLLVPVLGAQYGAALEGGVLRLRFDPEDGGFAVWAHDAHKLPVRPVDYSAILGDAHPALERLGDAFGDLRREPAHLGRRASELKAELARVAAAPEVRAAIDRAVARFEGTEGDLDSWRALDALIGRQRWRVAHFRVASDAVNYRRFFNINELAGLRMEQPELFHHAHVLVLRLIAEGALDGLRIDHIDGLYDPKGYLARLREAAPRPIWLVVEKILARHERLRADWPADGATGYEMLNVFSGVLVDPAGEEELDRFHAAFTGEPSDFGALARACKVRIMEDEMAAELATLAREAERIAASNPMSRDFTRNSLARAMKAIVACFPVYRTYVDGGPPAPEDRRDIDWAVAQARRMEPGLDASVFDMLHAMLTTDLVSEPRSGYSRSAVIRFAMRFQQYTGPVMAKGLEDTAFYRWTRFLALNEVGGHPEQFGTSVAALHHANAERAERAPRAMLATGTHDAKRGEDARARLAALSERAEDWTRQVEAWSRLLRARRGDVAAAEPPDRSDEYMIFQMMLGAVPPELLPPGPRDPAVLAAFAERLCAAVTKSLREGKRRSSWTDPDEAYEAATLDFVRHALDPERGAAFLDAFLPFAAEIAEAGARNGLVQAALKLTAPGVPDLYQGTELWDFAMVDPDNRRKVDFARRAEMLEQVRAEMEADPEAALEGMLRNWRDGRIKMALTQALLRHRAADPALYRDGRYARIEADGPDGDRAIAWTRSLGDRALLLAARRFPARGAAADATLSGDGLAGRWRSVLTGETVEARDGRLSLAAATSALPVGVWERMRG